MEMVKTMKIVIEIPEERFKDIQRIAQAISYRRLPALEKVIANGIVLPENHGRLIDADAFERSILRDTKIEDKKDVIYALREYKTVLKGRDD